MIAPNSIVKVINSGYTLSNRNPYIVNMLESHGISDSQLYDWTDDVKGFECEGQYAKVIDSVEGPFEIIYLVEYITGMYHAITSDGIKEFIS